MPKEPNRFTLQKQADALGNAAVFLEMLERMKRELGPRPTVAEVRRWAIAKIHRLTAASTICCVGATSSRRRNAPGCYQIKAGACCSPALKRRSSIRAAILKFRR
jgi:hypothetical protein